MTEPGCPLCRIVDSRAPAHIVWQDAGDRDEDVMGARANGIHAIAVTWGYAIEGELAAAQPDAIVRSPAELLSYLERAV